MKRARRCARLRSAGGRGAGAADRASARNRAVASGPGAPVALVAKAGSASHVSRRPGVTSRWNWMPQAAGPARNAWHSVVPVRARTRVPGRARCGRRAGEVRPERRPAGRGAGRRGPRRPARTSRPRFPAEFGTGSYGQALGAGEEMGSEARAQRRDAGPQCVCQEVPLHLQRRVLRGVVGVHGAAQDEQPRQVGQRRQAVRRGARRVDPVADADVQAAAVQGVQDQAGLLVRSPPWGGGKGVTGG